MKSKTPKKKGTRTEPKKKGVFECKTRGCKFTSKTEHGVRTHVKMKHKKDLPPQLELIQKQDEFKLYLAYKSVAPIMKHLNERQIQAIGMEEREFVREIMGIKNQGDFAKKYHIHPATLTEWNKKITDSRITSEYLSFWRRMTNNIYAAFYTKTLEEADAPRVRLWLEAMGHLKTQGTQGGGGGGGGSDQAPQVVNVQFNQKVINLNAEYSKNHRKLYEEAIKNEPDEINEP